MAFVAILFLATLLALSSSTSLTIVATLLLIRAAAVFTEEKETSSTIPLTYSPRATAYEISGNDNENGVTTVAVGHEIPSFAAPSTQKRIVSDSSAGTFPSATTHTAATQDTAATSMATGGTTVKDLIIEQDETTKVKPACTSRPEQPEVPFEQQIEEFRKLQFWQDVLAWDPIIESWRAESAEQLPYQPPTLPGSSRTVVCLQSYVEEDEDGQSRDQDFEDGLEVFNVAAKPQLSDIAEDDDVEEMEHFSDLKCLKGVPQVLGEGPTTEELLATWKDQLPSWITIGNVEIGEESEEAREGIQAWIDLEAW